jgi:hypothetical protein
VRHENREFANPNILVMRVIRDHAC